MSDMDNMKLIQLLSDLELSPTSLDFYLKMLGQKPLNPQELQDMMGSQDLEVINTCINELIEKGLCTTNAQTSPENPLFYALPPYPAMLKFYENFNLRINALANKLPEEIGRVLQEFTEHSDILAHLNNYASNYEDAKSTIITNINLIRGDFKDSLALVPELKKQLGVSDSLFDMIESVFNLQIKEVIKEVRSVQEIIDLNLEDYGLQKKKEAVDGLINKIIEEKVQILQFNFQKKIPEIFGKHKTSFKDGIKEITEQIDRIASEFESTISDLLEEYEETVTDQGEAVKHVYLKELDKISVLDELLSSKIFEVVAKIFNIISSPIQLNSSVLKYLQEKAINSPLPIVERTQVAEVAQKTPITPQSAPSPIAGTAPQSQLTPTSTPAAQTQPTQPAQVTSPASELIGKTDNPFAQRFLVVLNAIDTQPGEELSEMLQDVSDYILEQKGFSVVLSDVRRFIGDLKGNKGLLTEGIKKVLQRKIYNWIERLTK